MAGDPEDFQALLKGLEGVEEAYLQAPSSGLKYPCIMIERGGSRVNYADNLKYFFLKSYTVIVVDRDVNSKIPDLVEALKHSRFDRYYRTDGLHHFAFQIFF